MYPLSYRSISITLLLLLITSAMSHSAILKVPENYSTIQAGINAAVTGDTVSVLRQGTYPYMESLIIDKGILVVTRAGTARIEAISGRRVITILNCIDTVKMIGFDISNGAPSGDTLGDWGGGILVYNAPAVIEHCYIHDNTASGSSGGGVCFRSGAYVILRNNFIYDNTADFGGGVMASTGHVGSVIESNVIHNNSSLQTGGGVWIYDATYNGIQCDLRNNSIVSNYSGRQGSGLQIHNVDATVLYNIIAFNHQAGVVVEDSAGAWIGYYGLINWDCNDIYANCNGNNYHSIYPGPDEFSLDPEICDTTTDNYHLTQDSPCIAINNGCGVLIGALKEGCDQNIWYVDNNSEYIFGNGTPEFPFLEIPEAVNAASADDTIYVYPGIYQNDEPYIIYTYLTISNKNINIISTNGPEVTTITTGIPIGECMSWRTIGVSNCKVYFEGFNIHGTSGCDPGESIMMVYGADVTLKECTFSGGMSGAGTAIYANDSRLSINRCDFRDLNHYTACMGGAIYADDNCNLVAIDSSTFSKTVVFWLTPAGNSVIGGAIASNADTLIVHNCDFDNIYSEHWDPVLQELNGGVIWSSSSYMEITGNVIKNNIFNYEVPATYTQVNSKGTAIYLEGSGIVKNNTLDNNNMFISYNYLDDTLSDANKAIGGAVYSESPNIVFNDNIITNNSFVASGYVVDTQVAIATYGGGFYGRYSQFDSNLVWGNYPDEVYHPYGPDSIPEYINFAPRFCNEEYYLAANSPARGAATDGSDIGARQGNYCDSLFIAIYADSLPVDTIQHGTREYPYATIQATINVSLDGDTVMLLPGTYIGDGNRDITTFGKAITVMGEKGPDSTVIDVQNLPVDGFNISGSPTLTGLTIMNSQTGVDYGFAQQVQLNDCNLKYNNVGVLSESGGSIQINNCIFNDNDYGVNTNHAYDQEELCLVENSVFDGNAIAAWGTFTAINDTIRSGEIGFGGNRAGGGNDFTVQNCIFESLDSVAIYAAARSIAENCTFTNNSGFVAQLVLDRNLWLIDCNIYENPGPGILASYHPVGMYSAGLYLEGCLYSNNGGGIIFEGTTAVPGTMAIENSTFVGIAGNAVYVNTTTPSNVDIANSIIAYNTGYGLSIDSVHNVSCCDVYQNTVDNYDINRIPDQTGLNGNLSEDPFFCYHDTGNYYLAINSPCAPDNNSCDTLIGALPVNCGLITNLWHVDTAGSDITGNGSEENPFATLSKAVSLAIAEDTILIHEGVYTGDGNRNVTIDKKIYIRGAGKDSTVFEVNDGGIDWTIWQNVSYSSNEIAVSGISVNTARYGVNLDHSSVSLSNVILINNSYGIRATTLSPGRNYIDSCEFIGNESGYLGNSSSITAGNCIFVNNTGICINAGYDEGMYDDSIFNCEFYNNYTAVASGNFYVENCKIDGGNRGLWCIATHRNMAIINCEISGLTEAVFMPQIGLIISNCQVINNSGSIIPGGDDLLDVQISGSVFYNNGGGINFNGVYESFSMNSCLYAKNGGPVKQFGGPTSMSFTGCTFADNSNGAIQAKSECSISSSVIANNESYGIKYDQISEFYSCSISNCIVNGNDSNIIDPYGGIDTSCVIDVDPQFCCPDTGDYYLATTSPCLSSNNLCEVLMGKYDVGCVEPCDTIVCGDANGNGTINLLDVTYLINYLYKGGPEPVCIYEGDANGNGAINILDVTYLINYLYKGGPAPICP